MGIGAEGITHTPFDIHRFTSMRSPPTPLLQRNNRSNRKLRVRTEKSLQLQRELRRRENKAISSFKWEKSSLSQYKLFLFRQVLLSHIYLLHPVCMRASNQPASLSNVYVSLTRPYKRPPEQPCQNWKWSSAARRHSEDDDVTQTISFQK